MESVVPIIIILIFVFGGVIKRLLERVAQQVDGDASVTEGYEAPPEEVSAFLQTLQSAGRPRVQAGPAAQDVQPPRAAGGVADEQPVPFGPGAQDVQRLFTVPASQARPAPPPPPPVEVRVRKPRRVAKAKPKAPTAERGRQRAVSQEAARAGVVPPLALRRFGLKQAVVWSEILGKPVSLRGPRTGPPVRRSGLEG